MDKPGNPANICYLEIPAPDIEKMGSFYSSVFQWKVTPSNLSDYEYWEFSTGEGQLTGGLDSSKQVQLGGVILYLKVEDIDETLSEISKYGGKIVRTKFDIGGGHGSSAIFQDPCGNTLGLFAVK